MDKRHLNDLICQIYDAVHCANWTDVGNDVLRRFGGVELVSSNNNKGTPSVFVPVQGRSEKYLYYSELCPHLLRSRADLAADFNAFADTVRFGFEVVPDIEYFNSEYYADFGRKHGRRHLLAGLVGDSDIATFGIYRDSVPFTDSDRRALELLLPHIRRAASLSRLLDLDNQSERTAIAWFDGFRNPTLVVDGGMHVLYASASARRAAAMPCYGLRLLLSNSRGETLLSTPNREDDQLLRSLVQSAASGGGGGVMRVRNPTDLLSSPSVAEISPVKEGASRQCEAERGHEVASCKAMVVWRCFAQDLNQQARLLRGFYGLSVAESTVAVLLVGGNTAQDVAEARNVTLDTIRTQIRSVLRKMDASNLRDFERKFGQLESIGAVVEPGVLGAGRGRERAVTIE